MLGVPRRDDSPPFATPPASWRACARPRRVCRSPSARVVTGDARTLSDPAPTVAERADSSVNLVVRPWCAAGDEGGVRWALTRKLEEELEADGCNIPFP